MICHEDQAEAVEASELPFHRRKAVSSPAEVGDGIAAARPAMDPEIRRRRLLFRCWHGGTQEIDLILGSFAEASLTGFDGAQLDRFESLLECADPDLLDWITGHSTPPPAHDHDVMRLLRAFSYRQKKG